MRISTTVTFYTILCFLFLVIAAQSTAQYSSVVDDFEGDGTISSWEPDDLIIDTAFPNPLVDASNPSTTVLRYEDTGGTYSNVRFTNAVNYNMTIGAVFSLKIYIPSDQVSGSAPLQLSLKLQNGYRQEPWTSQTEIIHPVLLDEWQTLTFDFNSGDYLNFDSNSPEPIERVDLNRVVIQVNGENNNDPVIAYIDDLNYDGLIGYDPDQSESVFDQLVWSDEFDGEGPVEESNWHHQTQIPNPWGWFNEEQQHYTDELTNSYVEDGSLFIVAKREDYTDQGLMREFTSARLNSKFAFTYGRVEARARLPFGVGTWPAIWTLGKNVSEAGAYWYPQYGTTGWPACGEIDIMEHWGWNQHYISAALHTPSSSGATENTGGLYAADVSNEFHIYGMEWDEEEIRFTLDGQIYYVYHPQVQNASTWPYVEDQYLIMNVAIQNGVDPGFQESAMEVDYVRVYQSTVNSVDENERDIRSAIHHYLDGDALMVDNDSKESIGISIVDLQGRLLQKQIFLPPGLQEVSLKDFTGPFILQFQSSSNTWGERIIR
ncbi:MAG: glycoside hydrolase family 16 protein [Flavobacteriales bacterium]|nr:glycoside hydrolase family 16 protein [Flavobacteriales bacterium]